MQFKSFNRPCRFSINTLILRKPFPQLRTPISQPVNAIPIENIIHFQVTQALVVKSVSCCDGLYFPSSAFSQSHLSIFSLSALHSITIKPNFLGEKGEREREKTHQQASRRKHIYRRKHTYHRRHSCRRRGNPSHCSRRQRARSCRRPGAGRGTSSGARRRRFLSPRARSCTAARAGSRRSRSLVGLFLSLSWLFGKSLRGKKTGGKDGVKEESWTGRHRWEERGCPVVTREWKGGRTADALGAGAGFAAAGSLGSHCDDFG